MTLQLLLIEDNDSDAALVVRELQSIFPQLHCDRIDSLVELRDRLLNTPIDIVISDYNVPGFDAQEGLNLTRQLRPDVPFILVSGAVGEEIAVEMMRSGAQDYLMKSNIRKLPLIVKRALSEAAERKAHLLSEAERLRERDLYVKTITQSNESLKTFAAVVATELHEPLRMIMSYLELIHKKYEATLDIKIKAYIEFARDGAKRMKELLRDLLLYEKLESQELRIGPVDINTILDILKRNHYPELTATETTIGSGTLPLVQADFEKLQLLFDHLIQNAIKFRKPTPNRIDINVQPGENEWTFSVRDEGIGIDSVHHQEIFALFKKVQLIEELPGNGLGLAICKRIVEKHHGRIWIESAMGRGATIFFTLPRT